MSARKLRYRKPRRSLRTILMVWFLFLSLVPLMFVTGYSIRNYEQAIDKEVVERLRANAREFIKTIEDSQKYLDTRRQRHRADPMLSYYLLTNSVAQARALIQGSVRSNPLLASVSLFSRDGQLVASISQDELADAKQNREIENASIYLSDAYKEKLEKDGQMTIVDRGAGNSMDLIAITRLDSKTGRVAGYIEEIITIGTNTIESLKKRLNSEIILFDSNGKIAAGSHPDFALYEKDYFSRVISNEPETFFDLTVRNEPFGFITMPVKWGDGQFMVGIGASKQKSKAILRRVNLLFFVMICAIGIILVPLSIFATRVIVKPVYDLVDAIQMMDVKDGPVEIPISTDTELGVLTESFNEMSRRIYQAKVDLEKKIKELEVAYSELKDTQARLVHSAKMASLGQMVAGIAHELNNPIGFIYSNMSHLRDYSKRLETIIDAGQKSPDALEKAKKDNDFDYVVKDLPRLISSCEEGARRTRDIVMGLRSFSRLEEAKIKRVSLKEGIEDTLHLLSGEIKNRIQVQTEYGPVPEVLCYSSELNQVFMNILTNAAQAIEGEGKIWIKLTQIKFAGKQHAQVSIRDSGKGIPKDDVEKIFDPFYTTKTVGQGTGLGLSISYGIVKKHGGDIQVRSELGKGTEFLVNVPIDGPPGAEAEPAKA